METPNFESDAQRRYWLVATKLHYRGTEVTVSRVRELTSGSPRDVTPVVKKFKEHLARIAELEQTELPPELDATIQKTFRTLALKVWEDARELASSDTTAVQADLDEALEKIESLEKGHASEVVDLRNDAAKIQIDLEDGLKELKIARGELKASQESLGMSLQENNLLKGDLRVSAERELTYKEKIEELKDSLKAVTESRNDISRYHASVEGQISLLQAQLESALAEKNIQSNQAAHYRTLYEAARSGAKLSTESKDGKNPVTKASRRKPKAVTPKQIEGQPATN